MFTGIITNLGIVESLKRNKKNDLLLKISTAKDSVKRKLEIGCSIACNGICLTLIEKKISGKKVTFSFQASDETIAKTNLKNWQIGNLVNLEFSLRLGDELSGHMVLGHIDDCVKILAIEKIKDSFKFSFENKKGLRPFISQKCSVTLDGVSLTVNEVQNNCFSVNIIPHTFSNTCFKNYTVSDSVNIEIDLIARHLKNLTKISSLHSL